MGSNSRQKKAGFNLFNMFKSKRPRRVEDAGDDTIGSGRKIWPSDEDKGSYVADPRINSKATKLIADFYARRSSESELHAVYQTAAYGKAS